jgi:hypothetical protein
MIWRHMPRGNFTSSPCTSAPARRTGLQRRGSPRKMIPTSSRIVSAFHSMSDRPSSSRTSNGFRARQERRAMGVRAPRGRRAAPRDRRRAGRGRRRPGRLAPTAAVGHLSAPCSAADEPPVRLAGARHGAVAGAVRPERKVDDGARFVDGAVACGNAIASTKCSWNARLDRGLDLLDGAHDPLDLVRASARAARSGARCPRRCPARRPVERRVRHEPEDSA